MKLPITIPQYKISKIEQKILHLNKKARKLNLSELILNIFPGTEEIEINDNDQKITVTCVKVSLKGDLPKINGYSFRASLEFNGESNIIKTVPGSPQIPQRYWDRVECDHCGIKRKRIHTILLQHENGQYIQVGRTCLTDFLGDASAENFLKYYTLLEKFFGDLDEIDLDTYSIHRDHYNIDNKEYLSVVAAITRKYGFISRKQVIESCSYDMRATADTAIFELFNKDSDDSLKITDEDKKTAELIIDCIENLDVPINDYIHNLKTIIAKEYCKYNQCGLLASAIIVYKGYLNNETEKEGKLPSEHQGEIKEKFEKILKIIRVSGFSGNYGYTNIYNFRDTDNNVYIWYTGTDLLEDVPENEFNKYKFTVKDHNQYNGIMQTIITRVKMI